MSDEQTPAPKAYRGFAAMDKFQRALIASRGGKAAHERGVKYEWNSEQAREAGRKGGLVRAAKAREAAEALAQAAELETL